jgi:hypothetical protein
MFKENSFDPKNNSFSLEEVEFINLLRKYLCSEEIENILNGQKNFKNISKKYEGFLVYSLVHVQRGERMEGCKEQLILSAKYPTEHFDCFKTVASLDILSDEVEENGHCRVTKNDFKALVDISRTNHSLEEAIVYAGIELES